jgi:starch phosphorylase
VLSQPPEHLPQRIHRLWDLAHNLWWSWHPAARTLFRGLDYALWRASGHNPVAILRQVDPGTLARAAEDPSYLRHYDDVIVRFDEDLGDTTRRTVGNGDLDHERPIAYFSAEFGLHSSVPMYSGGLGVLAGDHCREASDLRLPMVGVGLLYQKGYFHQRIKADGSQVAIAEEFDAHLLPLVRVMPDSDRDWPVEVRVGDRVVRVTAWRIMLGCIPIYLLDTDLAENEPEDRELSAQLYSGDHRMRIRQEVVLGIAGVRLLRSLSINPSVWHMNEGHTAFLSLERIAERMAGGQDFEQAVQEIRRNALFTTHTPVPAGHDRFSRELTEEELGYFIEHTGMDPERVFGLGREPGADHGLFSMAALALRTSEHCNGVSERHGEVARSMWQGMWPDRSVEQVPIGSITNGVHVPTWVSPELRGLLSRNLGPDWLERHHEQTSWDLVADIPAEELWQVHRERKARLALVLRERVRRSWVAGELETVQTVASGLLLDPGTLTLGFARRFAGYKRADLLFHDLDRLKRLLVDPHRPVQVVFAGKAHPRDEHGQGLIKRVHQMAMDPGLAGRIAFIEDYDLHLAHYLTSGVDVWMNTPRPPMEASGTSGQKAALNGVPHFSTPDGWWLEGYDGTNGWNIGDGSYSTSPDASPGSDEQDQADAASIYALLESTIIPLYYERDRHGVPLGWVEVMRQAIRNTGARFSSRRMLLEYVEKYYVPALRA